MKAWWMDGLIDWLIDWSIDWMELIDWLMIDGLIDWSIDRLIARWIDLTFWYALYKKKD